jgi:hypothetical protein
MIKIFRKSVEKMEARVAEKRREVELVRIAAFVDVCLKAQDIEDPEARDKALSFIRPLIQKPTHKQSPPNGPF